jgi:hypothetical protein
VRSLPIQNAFHIFRTEQAMNGDTPSPTELLEQARELGARIGALSSLGAGITAAIGQHTIEPEHVYLMIDGYVANLVALNKRLEDGIASLSALPSSAHVSGNRSAGDELAPDACTTVGSFPWTRQGVLHRSRSDDRRPTSSSIDGQRVHLKRH